MPCIINKIWEWYDTSAANQDNGNKKEILLHQIFEMKLLEKKILDN